LISLKDLVMTASMKTSTTVMRHLVVGRLCSGLWQYSLYNVLGLHTVCVIS